MSVLWRKLMKAGGGPDKKMHNADDSECIFWAGDFAGVDLRAVCPVCEVKDDPIL